MPDYSTKLQRTLSTTASVGTIGAVSTTRARRGRIFEITVGSEAVPNDAAILWQAQRYTAKGTNTAVTPRPVDPADDAFLGEAGENNTIEPTYTAGEFVWTCPLNQRATFRWIAVQGKEIIYPATTANGIGFQTDTISTGTPVGTIQVYHTE